MAQKIRVTSKIRAILDGMSIQEVQFFANIAESKEFPTFKEYVRRMIDYEKEYFFNLNEGDPQKLAIEKAHARGKVASLADLVYILIGASEELEKRLKKE